MTALLSRLFLFINGGANIVHLSDQDCEVLDPTAVRALTSPISFHFTRPNYGDDPLTPQSATVSVSNIRVDAAGTITIPYLYTIGELEGILAYAEHYSVDDSRVVCSLYGTVSDPRIGRENSTLTITSIDADDGEGTFPKRKLTDSFPDAVISDGSVASDASYQIPFGLARRVPLTLIRSTFSLFTTVVSSLSGGVAHVYYNITSVPGSYVPTLGDVLEYTIYQFGSDARCGLDLIATDATTLLSVPGLDQNNLSSYPLTDISAYAGFLWYRRRIPLPISLLNQTIVTYRIGFSVIATGTFFAEISNAVIKDKFGNIKVEILTENTTDTYSAGFISPGGNTQSQAKFPVWDYGAFPLPSDTNYSVQLGGSDTVTPGNSSAFNQTSFTWEGYFKANSSGSNEVLIGRAFTGTHGWAMYKNSSNKLAYKIVTSGGTFTGAGTTTIGDGTRRRYSISYNATTFVVNLYINGVLEKTATLSGTFTTGGGSLIFGGAVLSLSNLTGDMTDVIGWDTVLSALTMVNFSIAKKVGLEPHCIGYWKFSEGSGTNVRDYSSGRRDATITSGGTWITGPALAANVVINVYSDDAIKSRDDWSVINEGLLVGASVTVRTVISPKIGGASRLPVLTADVCDWGFDQNPANALAFVFSDSTFGRGKVVDPTNLSKAVLDFKSLIYPDGYQIDGCVTKTAQVKSFLPLLLLRGTHILRFSDGSYGFEVDKPNLALDFNGAGKVTFGDVLRLINVQNFSLGMWINPTSLAANSILFSKFFTDGSGSQGWVFGVFSTGLPQFIRYRDNAFDIVTGVTPLTVGVWTYIEITYDGTTLSIFRNGVFEASVGSTRLIKGSASADLTLGARTDSVAFYTGKIDSIRCYNFARTGAQQLADYTSRLNQFDTTLFRFFLPCDEKYADPSFKYVYEYNGEAWYSFGSGVSYVAASLVTWDKPRDKDGVQIKLGDADYGSSEWKNAEIQTIGKTKLSERINEFHIYCGLDPGFSSGGGGSTTGSGNGPKYLIDAAAGPLPAPNDRGKLDSVENPFIEDYLTAIHEARYVLLNKFYSREEVNAKISDEARYAQVGQLIPLIAPNEYISEEYYKIGEIDAQGEEKSIVLMSWDEQIHAFIYDGITALQSPTSATGIENLSRSRPNQPTGFSATQTSYSVDGAGQVTVTVRLQATVADDENTDAIYFAIYPNGSANPAKVLPVFCKGGDTKSADFHGLSLLTSYGFDAYGFASGNFPLYQEGVHTSLSSLTTGNAPGAPVTPATPTAAQGTGKTIRISLTANTELNIAGYQLFRTLSGVETLIQTIGSHTDTTSGNKIVFIDSDASLAYGSSYTYRVKAFNSSFPAQSSQISGFSSATSAVVLFQLGTGDYGDGTITNVKVNDISAVKVIAGLLTINPSSGGATGIQVNNAGQIVLRASSSSPGSNSALRFEDASPSTMARMAMTTGGALWLYPEANDTYDINLGGASERWNVFNIYGKTTLISAETLTLNTSGNSGTVILGRFSPTIAASSTATPANVNGKISVYQGGSFYGYIATYLSL